MIRVQVFLGKMDFLLASKKRRGVDVSEFKKVGASESRMAGLFDLRSGLPVHPVYRMQEFVLSGAEGAHSAEGAEYAKCLICFNLSVYLACNQ